MPDDKRALPLTLSTIEVIFLTDAIENSDVDQGDTEEPTKLRPLARDLLRKLMSLYNDLVTDKGYEPIREEVLQVTERQAWLMRGKVRTGTVGINKEVIGYKLLLKIHEVLLRFNTEEVLGREEGRPVELEPGFSDEDKAALKEELTRGEDNA